MNTPSYYAVIPANVRYDQSLCANAKLLYGEITALSQSSGKCFASNDYFAKLYGVSKTSISKWIKQLCDGKYIETTIVYKKGTKEILHRYLTLVTYPPQEKLYTPPQEKLKDNNTSINITSIKEKNTKNSLLDEYIEYDTSITDNGIEELKEFIEYRKKIKKPIKTVEPLKAYIKAEREILKAGLDLQEAKSLMKEREWQTLKADWIVNSFKKEKNEEREWK